MCDCYNNEIGFIKRKSVFKKEKPKMIVCLISFDNGKFFKKKFEGSKSNLAFLATKQ